MSVGFAVQKGDVDMKAADAVLSLRTAFDKVETMAGWLANHPSTGPDAEPLVTDFGYTTDEAYVLRLFFETMETVRTSNAETFATGRKMTGLN